jgi:NADH:quinone reductase (non-electrogenic)
MDRRWLFGLGAVAGAAATGVAVARARHVAIERAARINRLQGAAAAHGQNIVILGAGFGGLNAAAALLDHLPEQSGWKVTLVDRHNYFLFTPLLYHAATGLVDPSRILFPVRSVSRSPHFIFREATVRDVDSRRQVVHLDDGELSYDYLVLALGSITNFFGKRAEMKAALEMKSIGDAILLRNRIIDAYERADITTDPEERRRCLTFAVVGGGATGVELAGAVRGLIHGTLANQYPRIRPDETRVVLFEALAEILPGLGRELAHQALQRMRELGVEMRLETPIDHVDEDGLATKSGEYIPSRTVVWTAGVQPSPITQYLDLPRSKKGRILVDRFLQVSGAPNCYALGDIAECEDPPDGKPLPPNAAVAVQEGKAVADILAARLEGREPQPFRYVHRGELVSLGRNEAVAEVMGVRVTGLPAWLLWRAFYLSQLMGFKNKLSVALDWTFAYAYQRDTVRLELPCAPPEDEAGREAREEVAAGSR